MATAVEEEGEEEEEEEEEEEALHAASNTSSSPSQQRHQHHQQALETEEGDEEQAAPLSASGVSDAGAEVDGLGMKGYLSMRDEGLTYHRMKRFYCRCVGVNFCRFAARDTASAPINATFSAEVHKVESWDGKGLWHTYRNSFKLYFTTGAVFNVDADSEDDKRKWLTYIRTALAGNADASELWQHHADAYPGVTLLSLGGLGIADKKHPPRPAFKNQPMCSHPDCGLRFDSAKRQHHCRNCGGSMCSDHSSRFATLRHYAINNSVRLCAGCHRVQRFTVWLSMLVQRASTAQLEGGVKKPVLSRADEEEVEAVVALLGDGLLGISDIVQVLHLHRHGCDEAYAHVVAKLLELAETNLPDFEFFLPQLFQMWLTVDWSRNTIKAALLFRVVCFAAQLHIRFATSIYWLTRAAIDDSCGWGFGQSEAFVPEYLFRKFSLCKLMMINLEMQISQQEWAFAVDRDVPAPELNAQVISSLFDRLHVLARLSSKASLVSPLGELCDVISACSVPPEFLQCGKGTEVPTRAVDADAEWRVFGTQIKFVEELCDMTERLRHCAPNQRKAALRLELQKLELPEEAFCPIGSCEDPLQRFITIARGEGTVFTTRARAPTLVFFEVETLAYLAGKSYWMQRARSPTTSSQSVSQDESSTSTAAGIAGAVLTTARNGSAALEAAGSKNAIEVATSSDIGQALELKTLGESGGSLSSEAASRADESKHPIVSLNGSRANMIDEEELDAEELEEARDRVPSNPPPAPLPVVGTKKGAKSRRGRSGSLVNSTTKSLDSLISASLDTLTGRRKRSASEGEVLELHAAAQRNSSPLFNEVEKFTKDQLIRMAQNLEVSMLAEAPTCCGVFTGKDVVSWMTKNEIVFDDAHALWLGGELIESGAIEQVPASPPSGFVGNENPVAFTADKDAMYRLRSESTTIKPKPQRNPADLLKRSSSTARASSPVAATDSPSLPSPALGASPQNNSVDAASADDPTDASFPSSPTISNDQVQRQSSAYNADTSNNSSDGDRLSASATPLQSRGSLLEKFKPDDALEALRSVEEALEKHVFSRGDEVEDAAKIREDLSALKDQLEAVQEYVQDKQRQRHVAKESAFGESFDEKRQRLRMSSRHLQLCPPDSWDCVAFIVKSNDDLRQEVLCLQLIRQFQDIFQSADLPLRLLPYGIIATSASTGMIEYIKDATSLDALKKRRGYTTLANHFVKTYGELESPAYKTAMTNFAYVIFLIQGFLALQHHADTVLMMIAIMAQESSCPCFLSQNPRDILNSTKRLFQLNLDQSQVIKYVLQLVRRSHNSYRTRQYDVFQRMTNGILP
ncbi:hypothetical protein PybrP1_009149 [[Pythium] brassicae (nom. inval.)]|nr:hypothetical protein PybrP1_009149 [[Pythium] brassicae (nom. inval.)]